MENDNKKRTMKHRPKWDCDSLESDDQGLLKETLALLAGFSFFPGNMKTCQEHFRQQKYSYIWKWLCSYQFDENTTKI